MRFCVVYFLVSASFLFSVYAEKCVSSHTIPVVFGILSSICIKNGKIRALRQMQTQIMIYNHDII